MIDEINRYEFLLALTYQNKIFMNISYTNKLQKFALKNIS